MNNPEFEEFDKAVIEAVRAQIGETDPKPLLLSALGTEFQRKGVAIPKSAAKHIETHLTDHAIVIRHPEIRAYVAVCAPELHGRMSAKMLDLKPARQEPSGLLEKLPRALLVAFCKEVPQNKNIYIRKEHPLQYIVSNESTIGDNCVIIDSDLRLPHIWVDRIDSHNEHKELLLKHIEIWAARHNIRLGELLTFDSNAPETGKIVECKKTNALQRLLDGLRPDLRSELYIPADIIEILLRHP